MVRLEAHDGCGYYGWRYIVAGVRKGRGGLFVKARARLGARGRGVGGDVLGSGSAIWVYASKTEARLKFKYL